MASFSVSAPSFARMSKVLPPMVSKGISFNSKFWAGVGSLGVRGSLGGLHSEV